MTDSNTTAVPPAGDQAEETAPAKTVATETERFAVYDTERLRFVGKTTTSSKADATKTARDLTKESGRKHEVRSV